MSEEQLKAFLEAVKAEAGLQDKLKTATNADDAVAIAQEAGFNFSADDLKNQANRTTELSDEQLERVGGGTMCTNSTNGCEGTTVLFSILTIFDSGC